MWAIIYSQATERDANMLSSTLKQSLSDSFKMECQAPRMMKIQGNDNQFSSWKQSIVEHLKP